MGLSRRGSWLLNLFWVSAIVSVRAYGGGNGVNVKLVKTPLAVSPLDSATFGFEVSNGRNGGLCTDCNITCKLDSYSSSHCKSKEVSYKGLHDGHHAFEVCANGTSRGGHCASHNWTVDTVAPTAYVSVPTYFTSMSNVSVHIMFNKPCAGEGGFRCSSDYCSLLVYGDGHVIPSTLKVLQPDMEFSLLVAISTDKQYGRLVLVMEKNFCTDAAGNRFTRTPNSSFLLHFDRRNVSIQLRTHIPIKPLQLEGEIRTVEATNRNKNLNVYLYFSEPVLNSSAQILATLHTSSGSLSSLGGDSLGNRRFGYSVSSLSSMAIVTVTCDSSSLVSRSGTPNSPSNPLTFLYDAERPSVSLTTTDIRTREHHIPVLIKFVKPVFGFNSSAVSISGCHLLSFREISWSVYRLEVHADESIVSVVVPENTAKDVAGNKNLASNRLQVRHYSVPMVSSLVSAITTVVFAATSVVAALLTVSTASLLSSGAYSKSKPATYLISEPSRNLMKIACHIQVFALTKWLAVSLPIEYYEFTRGIGWSIPYLTLPWESEGFDSFTKDSTPPTVTYTQWERSNVVTFEPSTPKNGRLGNFSLYGTPLTPMEYRLFLEDQNMKPEAQLIMGSQSSDRWKYFGRNMFWLAVIGGGLMLLHAIVLLTSKLRRKKSEERKEYGALVFPRFELFLLFLALPCICQASATITRGENTAGIAVGIVLFGVASLFLLSLLLFLSIGITLGKLLLYKEVHREGQESHWYQELVRVTLGPGKRGQWTWKDKPNSTNLARFGPLFEDLRGPPKYMLSQFSSGPASGDRIIASDDETEDAEAPCIQKLFGILRIYYTFMESMKRASLGILVGIYSDRELSKLPIVILLAITAFQLFFLILKKPFIKKRVQLVELISVASELFVFAVSLVLVEKDMSESGEKGLGYAMLAAFVVGFIAQLINEWYALYWQIVRLSPGDAKFVTGLKSAAIGVLSFVLPSGIAADMDPETNRTSLPAATGEKPWMRQLRELAKESFSKEEEWTATSKDPSTSKSGFWSGKDPSSSKSRFWGGKRSGSSSVTSSSDSKAKGDLKAKSKGLYKDLEAIFSSK